MLLLILDALLVLVIVIMVIWWLRQRFQRTGSAAQLSGVMPGPAQNEERLHELLRRGRKIEAISLYRRIHAVGLQEAKEAVEQMMGQRSPVLEEGDERWTEIREALARGEKIQAIKLYRERTGAGLREAKEVIEQTAQEGERRLWEGTGGWPEIDEALARGEKIQAIKLYRERTGVGLREAKEAIDSMERRRGR
jgi:ribosomal protein L7/L12